MEHRAGAAATERTDRRVIGDVPVEGREAMHDTAGPSVIWETEPDSAADRFLEQQLYAFNVVATGISDGELFGIFLRGQDHAVIGGADGWFWGGTCYVRHLFVPAPLRGQGYGTRLMARIEAEANARGCAQMVLETHDFQAPDFYRRLGFWLAGTVENYPRGHQRFTFVKPLG